uniref:Acylamino-acid-releasing enzyme N-terminal domain-containing protein n=1 Tax=Panagrolaimus superbus TaxID=310955 RepID=A0A914YNE1_9BILA
MATKNRGLSSKDEKHQNSLGIVDTSSTGRYNNLNLNQNHKCSNLNSIQSQHVLVKSRENSESNFKVHWNAAFKKTDRKFADADINFSKIRNASWNKSSNNQSSHHLNLYNTYEESNLKKMMEEGSESANTSPQYDDIKDSVEQESKKKKPFGKTWKDIRQHFGIGSNLNNQRFEIPRQQEGEDDDVIVEPEVMQFKATQKLLDPKEAAASDAPKKEEEKKKEEGGGGGKKEEEKEDDSREISLMNIKTKATLSEIREKFAQLCLVKSPTSGRITKPSSTDLLTVFSQWSFRSPTMKKNLKTSQITIVDTQKMEAICHDVPVPEAEGQSIAYSQDGKLSAVISTITEGKDKKHYVRIIDAINNCDKNIFNLSGKKVHGLVHLSGDFGGAVFSPSGKYLLYTAERYANLVEFYDADLDKKSGDEEEDDTKKPAIGDKFLWKQSFGEQLFEVNDPVLCLLTVESGEVKILDSVPKHLHPVQKLFSADESTVYFGAVEATNYKLGKVFCTNRPFTIGRIDLKEFQYSCIAQKVNGLEFLKRSNDGTIFGISRTNSKASHQGSYSFFKLNPTSADKPVESYTHDDIFLPALSPRCFTSKDAIIFTAIYGCYMRAFKFNPSTSDIICLTPGEKSDTVLDVFEEYILVSRAAPDCAPELCIGKFSNDKEH